LNSSIVVLELPAVKVSSVISDYKFYVSVCHNLGALFGGSGGVCLGRGVAFV
jgi:hypothetical protein